MGDEDKAIQKLDELVMIPGLYKAEIYQCKLQFQILYVLMPPIAISESSRDDGHKNPNIRLGDIAN